MLGSYKAWRLFVGADSGRGYLLVVLAGSFSIYPLIDSVVQEYLKAFVFSVPSMVK